MEQDVGDAEDIAEDIVAYHEAGHAAIGILFDHTIDVATIIRDGDAAGGVLIDHGKFDRLRYEDDLAKQVVFERLIMASLAGVVAQKRYEPDSISEAHGLSDRAAANDYLDKLEPPTAEIRAAYLHLLELRTTALLELHWDRVERIAKALLKKKTLTPDELDEAFCDPERRDALALWQTIGSTGDAVG